MNTGAFSHADPQAAGGSSASYWPSKASPALAAILAAFFAYWLSGVETKWIAYIVGALLLGLMALLTRLRTWLLATYVMALQLNASYHVTEPPPYLFVGQSGETAVSIALVSLPALALVLCHLANGTRSSPPTASVIATRACVPVFALILATTISALASQARFQGMCTLVQLLQFALVFFTAAICIRSRRDVKLVYKLLIATLAIQSAVYFSQAYLGITFTAVGRIVRQADETGLIRPGGTVGAGPAGFAAFVEPLILVPTAAFLIAKNTALRAGYILLLGVAMTAALLTLSRTTWLGLPLGVVIVFLLTKHRGQPNTQATQSAVALICVAACAALVAVPFIATRLANQAFSHDWQTRVRLIGIALNMIKDNAILGVGPGGYAYNIRNYATPEVGWLYVVHNEYLMKWSDLGTVGILAWCAWFWSGLRRAFRCTHIADSLARKIAIGVAAALVVRMWDWLWWSHFGFAPEALLWFLFGFLVALERLSKTESAEPT